MNYQITTDIVGQKPYFMEYNHYRPNKLTGDSVVVLVCGGGHLMKIWEVTPDGRKGWALLLAEKGREVIMVEWACNSPDVYKCSSQELCRLTQKENMDLIRQVIEKKVSRNRKIIFLGWSMGGPQVFKLACDIIPKRTAAILGYGATGPLNFFKPPAEEDQSAVNLNQPFHISEAAIQRICDSPFFPREYIEKYIREYLVPISPTMVAIQSKRLAVKEYWGILTIKKTANMPPTLLVNGTRDRGHTPKKERMMIDWLKKYQADVTVRYMRDFSHLGMLCLGNEKIAQVYLEWLACRQL